MAKGSLKWLGKAECYLEIYAIDIVYVLLQWMTENWPSENQTTPNSERNKVLFSDQFSNF